METITVQIGSVTMGSSGQALDTRRDVEFAGEQLAVYREPGMHEGRVTDSRGVIETLYNTGDGRLIVHVQDWSHWQGEPDTYTLLEVSKDELAEQYPGLADAAGLGRALTLGEALVEYE